MEWVKETWATYTANAGATRDYRVQLRGNRSAMLFGVYLFSLIAIAVIVYSQTTTTATLSVVEAQRRLKDFYHVILGVLGAVVVLVTPALSATTVVAEKMRHSLDLVFSAPVSPKYYLVGKMIACYRYTWMLLVLSLPVTAACVVLGGATWSDVLVAFFLLSIHALIFTSLALMLSTLAPKPVSAICWSYAAVLAYLFGSTIAASMSFSRMYTGGAASNETSFLVALNPFMVFEAAPTHMTIGSIAVPNYLLALGFALLFSKICLLTAGSVLSPYGGKEVFGLRIHGLVYLPVLAGILAYVFPNIGTFGDPTVFSGILFNWILMPIMLALPFLTCYGMDGERRYWPNGLASVRRMLDGTPAGALPYLVAIILLTAAGTWAGLVLNGSHMPTIGYLGYVVFALGFWTFFWSIGRMASSALLGTRTARTTQMGVFIVLCVLPVPFLGSVASWAYDSPTLNVWDLYVLRPLIKADAWRVNQAALDGGIMLFAAMAITFASERSLRRRMESRKGVDAGNYAAA